jgi:DNA integrity scanning protein DisA with diadenylate cyclase activity
METTPKDKSDLSVKMILSGAELAASVRAKAMFICLDAVSRPGILKNLHIDHTNLVLVVRDKKGIKTAEELGYRNILVPPVLLNRMGQIKTSVILAFSQRMLDSGDTVVFLVGPANSHLDTLVVMRVGEEWEMFRTVNQPRLTEHIKRVVFQQVLTIALELAAEGHEGKAVGALFVVGDYRNTTQHREQLILNPFKGYSEQNRNILDEKMRDTVKNFATLDGAFIIKGNGVLVSAGTHIKPMKPQYPLPAGLGARHAAAAGITSVSKCVAITISQSTGTVRIWRKGQIITEIERPSPRLESGPLKEMD